MAASLKSMLGLEEVKAWSCCSFLLLDSDFEFLMRDHIDQIFLSLTGLYIPLLGAILRNAIDQGRHWGVRILESGFFRSGCMLSTRPEQHRVLLMHLMNSCDLVFLGISLVIFCLVVQMQTCYVTYAPHPRNSCV